MSWIWRSLPSEADDPPSAPVTEIDLLAAERAALLAQIRPRIRTARQVRIRSRIADLTRQMLAGKALP